MTKRNYIKKAKTEFKQKRKAEEKIDRNYAFGFIVGEYN